MEPRRVKNRIAGVGVELEGGWIYGKAVSKVVHDGSVKFSKIIYDQPNPPHAVGEIPSPKLTTEQVDDWIKKNYPQHVNETCGLHVHMSFKYPLNYMRLMTPDYTVVLVKSLAEWCEEHKLPADHPQWKRLKNPRHDHCAHIYLGDSQVRLTKKNYNSRGGPESRYTFVNYCYSMGDTPRKTVECRGLSMFETADMSCDAVHAVLNTTNAFLAKVREKEPRLRARVALGPVAKLRYRTTI